MKRLVFAFVMLALLAQGSCADGQTGLNGKDCVPDTDFTPPDQA